MRYACAFAIAAGLFASCSSVLAANSDQNKGYLERPPVFVHNLRDFPLTGLGIEMPAPGVIIPAVDISSVESEEFRQNDVRVQPDLSVKINWIRAGALGGFNDGWAAGISIPWYRNRIEGLIGGEPASGIAEGFGDIALIAKKRLWSSTEGRRLIAAVGIELPTGKDDAVFGQSNAVTNAYYTGYPQRMPLAWQPGSGSVDGYLAVSYGYSHKRLSYAAVIAAKLHTPGPEDVKIGDILAVGATGTYGVTRDLAGSLGIVMRSQANDDYPNAPPPGVNQPALAGTTVHGTTVYLDAGVRYKVLQKVVVGVGVRMPIVKPDDGLVPKTQLSLIFYPSF